MLTPKKLAELRSLVQGIHAREEAGACILDEPMLSDVAELVGMADEIIALIDAFETFTR